MAESTMHTSARATAPDALSAGNRRHDLQKLRAVIGREFGERVRTKWFLVSTILGPLFFAALTILPAWLALREKGSSESARIAIVDATGAGLGARVAQQLADSLPASAARPTVLTTDLAGVAALEAEQTRAVLAKRLTGVLVLDTAALSGREARYSGRNATSVADVARLRDVVRRQSLAVRLGREGLATERVQALTAPRLTLKAERITDDGKRGSGAGGAILAVGVAFFLYMMILLYGQSVLRSVLEEKTTRVAELVVASVRPDVLMAGKVLGVGAVGLLQQVIWLGGALGILTYLAPWLRVKANPGAAAAAAQAADAATGFTMPTITVGMVLGAIAFFILGYLLYSALFAAVGAMVNSEQEAQQASFPVMLPLIFSAVLIQATIANPETGLARFAAWFPLTAPIMMPMRMAMVSTSALEVAAVLLGTAASVAAVIWLSARVYRVGLLMYGKRPTLGELGRWIRQSA